jgi:tetratricopeptide (TPR) repeat protein
MPVSGRPLVALSFAVNYAIGGVSPIGYHLVNLALHVLCALTLLAIVRRALVCGAFGEVLAAAAPPLAFASALVFVLHPLQTEVVDYVSQRTESMMALAFLLTMYASLRVITRSGSEAGWTAAAIGACAAGALCKQPIVTAPLLALLFDAAFATGNIREALRRHRVLYGGLLASWVIVAALMQTAPDPYSTGFGSDVSPWTYALNQTLMIVRYLRLALVPSPLVLDYGLPQPVTLPDVLPFALIVVALLATVLALWRVNRPIAYLGTWLFVTLAPTSSFVPIATEVGAERRMYLPLAALSVLVVVGGWALATRAARVWRWDSVRPVAVCACAMFCAASLVLTMRRNAEYRDPILMWRLTVSRFPTARAHAALATELVKAGRRDEGVAEYRRAMTDYPDAEYGLGVELAKGSDRDEAIERLESFIRRRPLDVKVLSALNTIGEVQLMRGRLQKAADAFTGVIQRRPDNVQATLGLSNVHDARGLALVRADRDQDAVAEFEAAVALNPGNRPAQENLGHALLAMGRPDAAADHYRAALAVDPGSASLRGSLGLALAMTNETGEAVAMFEQALELDPRNAAVRESIGIAVQRFGLRNALRDSELRRALAIPVD